MYNSPLVPIAICLILGIVAGRWLMPAVPMVYVLVGMTGVAMACGRWAYVQSVAIGACVVALGMTLAQMEWAGDQTLHAQRIEGVVMGEPSEKPHTIGIELLVPDRGTTLRCYLWKDERSRRVLLGDALTMQTEEDLPPETSLLVRSWQWDFGGGALSEMSRWQVTRLRFLLWRHRLLEHLRSSDADESLYAVLAAMTLGDKSALTKDLRDTYAVSGASHILALSGLHLGIVYVLLTWLTMRRRRFWLAQLVIVASIWAFALLTGLSASITRAAIMFSLYAVFSLRTGRMPTLNVLAFAAIVILVFDVGTLFDLGFQMSFLAVTAILVGMPLAERLWRPAHPVVRWAWALVGMSVCAQVGVAPLVAYHFGRLPVYFLLTNFIVVPAATVILYGALLTLIIPMAATPLLWVVGWLNAALGTIASLPYASIDGLHPSVVQTVAWYVLIALIVRAMYILFPLRR